MMILLWKDGIRFLKKKLYTIIKSLDEYILLVKDWIFFNTKRLKNRKPKSPIHQSDTLL